MNEIINLIVCIAISGIVLLLCLFSCILASISDKYWEEERDELDKNDRR